MATDAVNPAQGAILNMDESSSGSFQNPRTVNLTNNLCFKYTTKVDDDLPGAGIVNDNDLPDADPMLTNVNLITSTAIDSAVSSSDLFQGEPFLISSQSPAFNTGNLGKYTSAVGAGNLDFDGTERISQALIDVGAQEFYAAPPSSID
jgi:hypothetical protein